MKTFKNPILSGFYPDPSICKAGDEYFLVTSTFAYFPGVPIFKSKNLVHWEQIGNILSRPSQLPLGNADVSSGIFAPTIRYNDGIFYMITTNVYVGKNFYVTATDPAGEWSEPHYIDGADGIDPSLFFENGKCWYHGTREKDDKKYYGDNEIYLQELDLNTGQLVGERHIIWHCALRNAVWPEAPHIYKINGWYYLLISEGGTGPDHAITVARSKTLTGYYEGFKSNPILTHRHLGKNYPIVYVGHGDLVETQNGEWWMVLLASRPYGGDYKNLGRETFLVPVSWENDWLVANYGIGLVREEEVFPNLPYSDIETTDSQVFDFRKTDKIPLNMMHLREPITQHYKLDERGLVMQLNKHTITELNSVSYLCLRQMHKSFKAFTEIIFTPENENESAGLVIFQNHKYNYQFLITGNFLRVIDTENDKILAETKIDTEKLWLSISANEQKLSFSYNINNNGYTALYENASATSLNTDTAGGFVGNTIGMYATSNGTESKNYAIFTAFEYFGTI